MTHLTPLSPEPRVPRGSSASLRAAEHPAYASVDGAIVPYPDVRIHVSAEALTGALSVFEGVKGYWDATGTRFSVRTPRAHYERLLRSARLLAMPLDVDYPEFLGRLGDLAEELVEPGRDLWFRATLYGLEGDDGEDTRTSLVVTAYPQPVEVPAPLALTVSSWCRGTDADLSVRIKTGANHVTGRMARVEARRRGADEAFLLNRAGRIAGATSACVVIATDDGLVSPPPEEGALDSLTVRALGEICARDGIPYVSRPVERTELLSAREVALAGTGTELVPVADVDGTPFPTDGLLATLGDIYRGVMRGDDEVDGIEMVPLVTRPAPVVELHPRELHAQDLPAAPPSPYFDVDHGHDTGALPRLDDDAFAALDADGPGVPTGAIPRQPQLHILTQRS